MGDIKSAMEGTRSAFGGGLGTRLETIEECDEGKIGESNENTAGASRGGSESSPRTEARSASSGRTSHSSRSHQSEHPPEPARGSPYRLAWMWVEGWRGRVSLARDLVEGYRRESGMEDAACVARTGLGAELKVLDPRKKGGAGWVRR